jgi:hypothetical protein
MTGVLLLPLRVLLLLLLLSHFQTAHICLPQYCEAELANRITQAGSSGCCCRCCCCCCFRCWVCSICLPQCCRAELAGCIAAAHQPHNHQLYRLEATCLTPCETQ